MPLAMLRAFVIYMAGSLVLTWLLMNITSASYWDRVTFVAAVGLAAGLICRMPDWNWHGYSTSYFCTSRLTSSDVELARQLFSMMTEVLGEKRV